jgi:hypothetical protein
MNFYLSAVDDLLRYSDDHPSVGIILCKSKNMVVAEYAVRDLGKPVGIAEFRVTNRLPRQFHNQLPTIEDLESELGKVKPRLSLVQGSSRFSTKDSQSAPDRKSDFHHVGGKETVDYATEGTLDTLARGFRPATATTATGRNTGRPDLRRSCISKFASNRPRKHASGLRIEGPRYAIRKSSAAPSACSNFFGRHSPGPQALGRGFGVPSRNRRLRCATD